MNTDSMNSELFFVWCKFWCCVWFGTALGGSLFGFGLMIVMAVPNPSDSLVSAFFGLFIGALWAGTVGLFIIPSFALLMYICFCNRSPYVLACLAGALTGIVSMPPLFFVTAPMGAIGAFFYARWYLSTLDSWPLREAEERRIEHRNHPFNFSIASLFGRTTAAAVMIAFWTLVIRNLYGGF